MVFSLRQGNTILCLFHVITHALGKANLFLIVGNFLHKGLSQQDSRKLSLGGGPPHLIVALMVRILRLSGALFTRGFFSKEQVIIHNYFATNRRLSSFILVLVSRLTLGYCLKLAIRLSWLRLFRTDHFGNLERRIIPIMALTTRSAIIGILISVNLELSFLISGSIVGYYWILIRCALVFLIVFFKKTIELSGFHFNNILLNVINRGIVPLKTLSRMIEPRIIEPFYLIASINSYKRLASSLRRSILVIAAVFVLLILW